MKRGRTFSNDTSSKTQTSCSANWLRFWLKKSTSAPVNRGSAEPWIGCDSRVKKTFHAQERDTPRVEALRALFWKIAQDVDLKDFVFIDESSAKLDMALLYGWGERGDRVPGALPFNRGENITMLGALNLEGLMCMMTVNGGTTEEVFLAFVEQMLVPVLRKGQVVVLDNLTSHKVDGVREAIEKAEAKLMYLPPYSPELNPIEQCWSKLKNLLRKGAARTRDALDKVLGDAMKCVTSSDAEGWFSECGYL